MKHFTRAALGMLFASCVHTASAADSTIYACVNDTNGNVRIVGVMTPCKTGESQTQWNVQGPAGSPGPAGATGPQGPAGATAEQEIVTSCVGADSAAVTTCSSISGKCSTTVHSCSPFPCDAQTGTCSASCDSNADCALGSVCDTVQGRCALATTMCADDFTVRNADGTTQSCSPYRCIGGACQQQCETNTDCAEDYACHTQSGVCLEN
jgi:hypothetical protein